MREKPPTPTPKGAVPREGSLRVRIRYCECDPMNVAHHGAYIAWLEMGRTELLRAAGVTYAAMEKAGFYLVVTRLECRYRRPALYDEVLEVRTRWTGGSRVRLEHQYEVVRVCEGGQAEPEVLMSGSSTLACVDEQGKVRELPEWLAGGG